MSTNRTAVSSSRGFVGSFRFDMPGSRGAPNPLRWVLASIVAIGGSLAACAGIAALGIGLDPAIRHYEHLTFADYGKLTIIGVAGACVAWQIVARLSSRAWWPFLLLAILVTLVGLLPDLWILHQGQPAAGVADLVVMHLALAVITYPALVFIAPQRRRAELQVAP
jgi:hypothetical protein